MSFLSEEKRQAKQELRDVLRSLPLFARAEESVLEELEGHVEIVSYRANVPILLEKDNREAMFVILSGSVQIQIERAAAGEAMTTVPLARRGEGEFIGELSLIDGEPHMADAMTLEPCKMLKLSKSGFLLSLRKVPGFALTILRDLARRLRQSGQVLIWQETGGALRRVATRLLEELKANGIDHPGGGKRIGRPLTHEQLAGTIGMTRETVTRTLGILKDVGAIRTEGRSLIVLDEARLKQCARRRKREEDNLEEFVQRLPI